MNRNTQAHFAELPSISIGRSKFDRSFNHKTTFNAGELIPVYVDATIMPGDTVNMNMSELVRMSTPITPVMDNLWMDTYFFFVPHRLVWDNWAKFMGENDNPWVQEVERVIPKLRITNSATSKFDKGSIGDYFGIPTGINGASDNPIEINALPFRAYAKIWNDWFRDQNVEKELYITKTDSAQNTVSRTYAAAQTDPYTQYVERGAIPAKVNKYHDYFTSCLPSPQKGPEVFLPLNGNANVIYGGEWDDTTGKLNPSTETGKTLYIDGQAPVSQGYSLGTLKTDPESDPPQTQWQSVSGIWGLEADLSKATGASVTAIRQAFAIQKFYERQARGGWACA